MTTLQEKTTEATPRPATETTTGAAPLRPHVIGAVFRRDFLGYFSNPAGYVFITLFVAVSSFAAFWQPIFFANNLANLDPLNQWMPYLLLFFIPAITMSAWAEEKREGTDELLLTLPARDVEVVLGKYLAALGIYTVALVFSLSHVIVLMFLGRPDLGVMFSTYLGYWLMGALFVAIGLVASILSSNVTVAFILGGLLCAVPVFLGQMAAPLDSLVSLFNPAAGDRVRRLVESLSVPAQFRVFGTGDIPLPNIFYFLSLAVAMLYINMVLLGRRHWAGGEQSRGRWAHALVRIAALVVALASLDVLVGTWLANARIDASEERLNTLSPESRALIKQIPSDRPVYIQAYYSPEVPREYVETKQDLLNLLQQYAALGGDRIRLNLVETERFSPQARDAEKKFGITPKRVFTVSEGRQTSQEIFLGVAFISGPEEVVIPFFDRGLPVEYELTRSIRVVSRSGRKKIGILNTDARLMGGFDFHSMGQDSEWAIVTELKKQYDVTSVSADGEIPSNIDVLLVAQPSSLTQKQIDNLTAYIRKGGATLLFLDPLPMFDPSLSPEEPKRPPGGPFGGGPMPEPKGSLQPLLDLLGVDWPTTQIVWNTWNPHPVLADLPFEVVFVGKGSGAPMPFGKDIVSSGLQEVVTLFPGLLRAKGGTEFIPLLKTSDAGGTIDWNDVVERSFFGVTLRRNREDRYFLGRTDYTLAARVKGPLKEPEKVDPDEKKDEKNEAAQKDEAKAKPAEARAIVIADLDMISDQFFELRKRPTENLDYLDFDNINFVLNCVDSLAGDESFVALRKHRPRHRTLEAVERQSQAYQKEAQEEARAADSEAKAQLKKAQERLDKRVEEVRNRKDLDERTKEIMLANLQDVENRRFEVQKATIEDEKRRKIEESRARKEQAINAIHTRIKTAALLLPPLPALILGLFVFGVRAGRENRGASPNRLV